MFNNFKSILLFLVVALTPFVATSCSEDHTAESSVTLYYMDVGDIGASMSFDILAPTYHGAKPSAFAIWALELDSKPIDINDSFVIDAESGAIKITNTAALSVGLYSLSIECTAGGVKQRFANLVSVNMLEAYPAQIEVVPSSLKYSIDNIFESDLTAQVTALSPSVSISRYELVQPSANDYFTISSTGVIGINSGAEGDFVPGIYDNIGIKVTTQAGEATFENMLSITIASKPLNLSYSATNEKRVEVNIADSSEIPTIQGLDVSYAIKSIVPQTDMITIDESTGQLFVAANNSFIEGDEYVVSVTAFNEEGESEFDNIYKFVVVGYIEPIDPESFSYDDIANHIQYTPLRNHTKNSGFVGDEPIFTLDQSVGAQIASAIAVDPLTGAINIAANNDIAPGDNMISVVATNSKGSATTSFTLSVVENINFFETISYGDNYGSIQRDATLYYDNQYRFNSLDEYTALGALTPTHDSKVELNWEITAREAMSHATIDSASGVITLSADDYGASRNGMLMIKATAGVGDAAISVKIPLCFVFNPDNGATVEYTPFVLRVNPRVKYESHIPVRVGSLSTVDPSEWIMEMTRNHTYFNINGAAHHRDGKISNYNRVMADDPNYVALTAGFNFLQFMWNQYANAVNKTTTGGSLDPLTYWKNSSLNESTSGSKDPNSALGYIDPLDNRVVINPYKFMLNHDSTYANGIFTATMNYSVGGEIADIKSSGLQLRPIFIWFDEEF